MIYYPEKRDAVLNTGKRGTISRRRNLIILAIVIFAAGTSFFFYRNGGFTSYSFATVKVVGLYCEACPPRIKKAIEEVPGVIRADVELSTSRALVYFDPSRTNPNRFVEAIAGAGTGGYSGEVLVVKKGGEE